MQQRDERHIMSTDALTPLRLFAPRASRGRVASKPPGHVISTSDYYGDESANTGGAGVTALRISDILRKAGVDLEVVAGFAFPSKRRSEPHVTFLGGDDLRDASKKSPRALLAGLWNRAARAGITERLADRDPSNTVVMVHQWTRYLSPAALAAVADYPHIVYVHDYFWACPTGTYYDHKQNLPCTRTPGSLACMTSSCDRVGRVQKGYRVARHLVKEQMMRASAKRRLFIHISERSRAFIEPLYPDSMHATIYHPIGTVPKPVKREIKYDVAYFGRLQPEKGVLELAASAKRMGKSCLFVGTGDQEPMLREQFPEATIINWIPRDEVFAIMQQCGAVVLPSLWKETWGNIVSEALSQDVPVLVSEHAGASELVTRFGGGIVFDPSIPASFDDAIGRVIADREAFSDDAKRAFLAAGLDEASYVKKYQTLVHNSFGINVIERRQTVTSFGEDVRETVPAPAGSDYFFVSTSSDR